MTNSNIQQTIATGGQTFGDKYWFTEADTRSFFKKRFLKDFTKFLGKQLCGGLLYDKVADRRPATLL